MIFLFFYLFIFAILFFFVITLIFIPYGFTIYSLITLVTVPQQIINIAKNKAIRRNHALEHATINVLEKYAGGRLPLSGLAQKNGFIISGAQDPNLVVEAAQEGLNLLKKKGRVPISYSSKLRNEYCHSKFYCRLVIFNIFNSNRIF